MNLKLITEEKREAKEDDISQSKEVEDAAARLKAAQAEASEAKKEADAITTQLTISFFFRR